MNAVEQAETILAQHHLGSARVADGSIHVTCTCGLDLGRNGSRFDRHRLQALDNAGLLTCPTAPAGSEES